MDKNELLASITGIFEDTPENCISPAKALRPDIAGMKMFDAPITGFAAADDPLFLEYKKPKAIGQHYLLPGEWLDNARTVVSLFFPFTEQVRASNALNFDQPSDEWLHGRIEGQSFISIYTAKLAKYFQGNGMAVVAPSINDRFLSERYTSNWSERHVAYACGLGTWGLSKGLITAKGISGRFTSLITDAEFEPTPRTYTGLYDYCTRCGECVKHCPANAISLKKGKLHPPCKSFLDKTHEQYYPRYGCGKCQTDVPCERGIPKRIRSYPTEQFERPGCSWQNVKTPKR
jgi:epoxyqueuosine reductase QueG